MSINMSMGEMMTLSGRILMILNELKMMRMGMKVWMLIQHRAQEVSMI